MQRPNDIRAVLNAIENGNRFLVAAHARPDGDAIGSILASAAFFIAGRRDVSIFIGQWPPTFLLFGLFHKLLAPSR